jgi:hypothetical protein
MSPPSSEGLAHGEFYADLAQPTRAQQHAEDVTASQQADYINHHQQFLLVVAARIPARSGAGSGPGASANLSVRTFWPTPPSPGRSVYTNEMTIVAQTVDKIVKA